MALGFSANRANIKLSAITSWYVRALNGATALKYTVVTDKNGTPYHTITDNPFSDGNTVQIVAGTGGVVPTGLTAGVTYYIVSTAGNTFSLAPTVGGTPIEPSANGTAPCYIFYADGAYYQLPNLYDGKISTKSLSQKDSLGREVIYGTALVASAKIFSTGKTNVLKVLDKLASSEISHVINSASGSIHNHGLADKRFGTKWKFVCDSDSDKNRYIELTTSRKIAKSETTELLTTAAPSYGTAAASDLLYTLNSIARTDIIPAGFSKFEVCDTYNGTFLDIGEIMNGKLVIELLTQINSIGCEVGYALKVDVSVESMQASSTELALLENLSGVSMFYKITLIDGTIVTLGTSGGAQIGIDWEFNIEKDSDGIASLRFVGSGIVLSTVLDAIFV